MKTTATYTLCKFLYGMDAEGWAVLLAIFVGLMLLALAAAVPTVVAKALFKTDDRQNTKVFFTSAGLIFVVFMAC